MSRELGVDLIPGQTLRTLADVEQMGLVEKEQTITKVRGCGGGAGCWGVFDVRSGPVREYDVAGREGADHHPPGWGSWQRHS